MANSHENPKGARDICPTDPGETFQTSHSGCQVFLKNRDVLGSLRKVDKLIVATKVYKTTVSHVS